MNTILHIQFGRRIAGLFITGIFTIISIAGYSQQGAVQNLKLKDVNSQKEVTLSNYDGKIGVVAVFFCNNCPYSTYYVDRLKELNGSYPEFQFLLINSSNPEFAPEESEANMSVFLKNSKWNIPYLVDREKTIMKNLNAKKCPEVFVLNTKDWKTMYSGAIDNNPQVASDVSDFYLKNALEKIKKGSSAAVTSVRPTGCTIK